MKSFAISCLLCAALLLPGLGARYECQQGCLAAATAYVNECANNGGTNCTQKAHDLSYCPCMRDCQPEVPVEGCPVQ